MNYLKQTLLLFPRKIISASISSCLFAIIFSMLDPDPFNENYHNYIEGIFLWTPIYFMYAAPVILVYGALTSLISEYIVLKLQKTNRLQTEKKRILTLGTLHLLFGCILFVVSLIASALFFLTDLWLARKEKSYTWGKAISSLFLSFLFFIISMTIARYIS